MKNTIRVLFLFYLLSVPLPLWGLDLPPDKVDELATLWTELGINYSNLLIETKSLKADLLKSQSLMMALEQSNADLELSLKASEAQSETLTIQLTEALKESELLKLSLQTASESLKEAAKSSRRERIKAGLIGTAAGIVLGGMAVGIVFAVGTD